jgi:hypothetical protein
VENGDEGSTLEAPQRGPGLHFRQSCWSMQRKTEWNGPEKVSFCVDNIQLPSAPILNDATSLPLQLSHGHHCLSLSVFKIRDFNTLVINQLVMIVNEMEVTAPPLVPNAKHLVGDR